MLNVLLIIHLVIAICLIGAVLLQRSEGGALGIGGGGGGLVSARGAATALGKLTWALAIGFLATSIALTILSRNNVSTSVIDQVQTGGDVSLPLPDLPGSADDGADLLPPAPADGGQAPQTPPSAE